MFLHSEGVFEDTNLAFIWPGVAPRHPSGVYDSGGRNYNPEQHAFDGNWVANGDLAPDISNSDP